MYSLAVILANSIPPVYDVIVWLFTGFFTILGDRDLGRKFSSNGLRIRLRRNIFTGEKIVYLSRDMRVAYCENSSDVLAFVRLGVSNGEWGRLVERSELLLAKELNSNNEREQRARRVRVHIEHQHLSMHPRDVVSANLDLFIRNEVEI